MELGVDYLALAGFAVVFCMVASLDVSQTGINSIFAET
jgi:hypothetical protein